MKDTSANAKPGNISNLNMGKMINSLHVGSHDGGLDLMCRLLIDGKEIQNFKGRSFVMPFAYNLHGLLHGGGATRFIGNISRSGDYNNTVENDGFAIDGVTNATPIGVSTKYSRWADVQDNDYIWIWGVTGTTAANGLHRVRRVNSENIELYEFDNVTPLAGNGVWTGGGYFLICGYRDTGVDNAGAGYQDEWRPLGSWNLCIGTDNTPVDIRDFGLHNRTGNGSAKLNYFSESDVGISIQTTNKPSSRFVLTKAYTNNSGGSIGVNEIGIMRGQYNNTAANQDDDKYYELLSRDVLPSEVLVPNGSTLTVEYEVVAKLVPDTQDTETEGTNGGFIDDFITDLRNLAQVDYDSYKANIFRCHAGPGRSTLQPNNARPDYNMGIIVGTDQTFVSMTNETLIARVEHGDQAGELYHFGNLIEDDVIVNDTAQTATIQIKRIFENRGSTAITIKEVGLNVNRSLSSQNTFSPQMIARTALQSGDWYTIQPGDFVQIQYDIVIEA